MDSVYEVTSPVMTNNAPEGSEVVDHEEARALDLKDLDDTDEIGHNDGGGSATHKAVMSACWRAMKQAGCVEA